MFCNDNNAQSFIDHVLAIFGKSNCNKTILVQLLDNIGIQPYRIMQKWEDLLPNHDEYEWTDIFSVAFKCAIDTKTRNFQYMLKFLHRIIATIVLMILCINCQ